MIAVILTVSQMSFQFDKAEHYLEIVDRSSTTFRSEHKFWITALQPSRFLHRDYFWTGSGAHREKLPEVVSDIDEWGFPYHRIHGPIIVEGTSRILVVDLGRTLAAGEKTMVHFRHRMKDLRKTFEPLFRVLPSSQVKEKITIRLKMPDWNGLEIEYRGFDHVTEEVLVSRKLEPILTEGGTLTFEEVFVNPSSGNIGHRIDWSHSET
jgi:hypothetical protein